MLTRLCLRGSIFVIFFCWFHNPSAVRTKTWQDAEWVISLSNGFSIRKLPFQACPLLLWDVCYTVCPAPNSRGALLVQSIAGGAGAACAVVIPSFPRLLEPNPDLLWAMSQVLWVLASSDHRGCQWVLHTAEAGIWCVWAWIPWAYSRERVLLWKEGSKLFKRAVLYEETVPVCWNGLCMQDRRQYIY